MRNIKTIKRELDDLTWTPNCGDAEIDQYTAGAHQAILWVLGEIDEPVSDWYKGLMRKGK